MKSAVRRTCFLFLLVLSLAALLASRSLSAQAAPAPTPDILIFTNGDQLTGKLIRGVGDSILFKSDIVGEVTVPLSKIKQLRSTTSFAVLPKKVPSNPANVPIGEVTAMNGNVTVAPNTGSDAITTPQKSVGYIVDRATYDREVLAKRGFFSAWTGTLTGGATVQQSTTYGRTFTATVNLVRTIPTVTYFNPRNRTAFNLAETYGTLTTPIIPQTNPPSPDSVVKTNIFHTDFERDRYLNRKIYIFAGLAFDHNFSQGLNLQQDYGAGLGWTPISNAVQQLDVKGDLHYEKQRFLQPDPIPADYINPNQNLIASAFTENYRRTLPLKIALTQTATINPAYNNPRAYSSSGSLTLALPVIKRFAVSFTGTNSFINNPAAGYQKNSLQFTTGITYTLK